MTIREEEPYKLPIFDEDEIFPMAVKKMSDEETKEYYRKKIFELSLKSINNTSNDNPSQVEEQLAELKEKIVNDNEPLNITYEDWNTTLNEKYQNLKNISDSNFTGLWYSLEFELSVFKILNIRDCTLPFAGILLGPPSSLKTVGIELFRKDKNTFYTDDFSARTDI